jgi:hypothetical protein
MPDEIEPGCAIERNRDEGDDNNGQNRVTGKHGEVYGPRQAGPLESRCTVVIVIREV